ncbi:glycerate kinase [Mycobacterium persicum]|uniref:glycerate kinase n=1 Tax=Mycobacterium persicum TaxID=1487726 RepID=UPI0009F22CFC
MCRCAFRFAEGATVGFQRRLADVDVIITGEGCLDRQTLQGKLPAVVARRAAPTPVIAGASRAEIDFSSTLLTDICTLADHSVSDASRDPLLSAGLPYRMGTHIGGRIQMSTGTTVS